MAWMERWTVEERFWRKVDRSGDCWMWTGARNGGGYGQFVISWHSGGTRRIQAQAHRFSLMLAGRDPGNKVAYHRCREPLCVNPDHLDIVESGDHRRLHAVWSKDKIITEIKEFADEFGRPPTAFEWNPSAARSSGWSKTADLFENRTWPSSTVVQYHFGSWSKAILAAGFQPRRVGQHGPPGTRKYDAIPMLTDAAR